MNRSYAAVMEVTGILLALHRSNKGEILRCFIVVPVITNNYIENMLFDCIIDKENPIKCDNNFKCGDIIHGSGIIDELLDGWFMLNCNGDNFSRVTCFNNSRSKLKKYSLFDK